jgi:hypothetical protein
MDGERATDGGGWRGSGLIGPAASKKLEQEQQRRSTVPQWYCDGTRRSRSWPGADDGGRFFLKKGLVMAMMRPPDDLPGQSIWQSNHHTITCVVGSGMRRAGGQGEAD